VAVIVATSCVTSIAAEPAKAVVRPVPAAVIDASKYPNLQAALDAVPESGGLVRLPPGEFRLDRPLVLSRGDTRVEGAGPATRLINCNRQGEPAMVIRAPKPKTRLWRVQVANFRINGDPNTVDAKSTKPLGGDGLLVEYVDEFYARGMSIDHHGGHGIHLVHCYEDPRIADCIITYNAKAGLNIVGGHDIVVNANQFEENQDAVRCIDSFNLCMNGNNIDDHLRDGVVIENTYGSVLSGNMIEECNGRAIVLDRDCYGITISANVIADNFGGGVDLVDAWGCTVSANTFTITAVRALHVGPQAGRITVTGNNFSDSFIGPKRKREGKPNEATGIVLEGTSDITITGNIFSGLAAEGVRADAQCRRILIANNVMIDLNRQRSGKGKSIEFGGAKEVMEAQNLGKTPPK
jgi:parallel beta-helix repeat protein